MLRLHGEKNLRAGWVLLALGGAGAAVLYAQVAWRGGAAWGFCGYMPVVLAVLGVLAKGLLVPCGDACVPPPSEETE